MKITKNIITCSIYHRKTCHRHLKSQWKRNSSGSLWVNYSVQCQRSSPKMSHPLRWQSHTSGTWFHWSKYPSYGKMAIKHNLHGRNTYMFCISNHSTWKFLWTHVTSGSVRTPFAKWSTSQFEAPSSGDVVSGESFMVLNSLSKISTISFSKKFKNSWASYRVIRKRDVTHGSLTLLCPYKVSIILFFTVTLPDQLL